MEAEEESEDCSDLGSVVRVVDCVLEVFVYPHSSRVVVLSVGFNMELVVYNFESGAPIQVKEVFRGFSVLRPSSK